MIIQLLHEIRELRKRVELLEDDFYKGKQNKKGIPDQIGIKPQWETEGISKSKWIEKNNEGTEMHV